MFAKERNNKKGVFGLGLWAAGGVGPNKRKRNKKSPFGLYLVYPWPKGCWGPPGVF